MLIKNSFIIIIGFWAAPVLADNRATELEAPTVEVIGTTPLPGIGTPVEQIPSNVQAATGAEIERQQSLDLSEFLERNLSSVSIGSGQNNPFQPDVNFRGFTASPLLGTPQGLSVFQDGVRINEPFGDTVNWDLIPLSAISSINLIPGSNPVFGLNTLGGALAIHTKSGFEYPGYSIKSSGGSFGRKQVEFEAGGHGKYTDYFVTGNFFDEDGFSDHSPSRVRQVFGKIGVQDGRTDFDLSFTGADNALEGAQTLPLSFLSNPNQAYTFPDRNTNRLLFFNLKGSHFINDNNLLAGNIYYRKYKNGNFSSNVNDNFDPLMPIAAGNTTAFNDVNSINQDGYGGSLQFTYLGDVLSRKNQFTAGLSLDAAGTEFAQFEQEALFTAERGTVAFSPNFALQTRVGSSTRNYGVYLTNNISITDQINLTTSGRFNRAQVKIRDETGLTPALNGDSVFTRFNPAVGLNYNPVKSFTTYAAYNEGLRAPSPVELTCADPAAPCRLPNNFLADPPLKPVISKTWEIGARGVSQGGIGWTTSVFRTDLRDDIQFISSGGAVNAGFFQNVGTTRRQGLELGVFTKASRWKLSGNYSYLDATFRTPFVINSVNNSSANAAGDIQVLAGNRIPGLPRHNLKARAEYAFTEKLSAGVNLVGFTRQYARGDENNQDRGGQIPGYVLVNLDARYQIQSGLEFFARINNVFDKSYQNLATLGRNFFTGPGNSFDAVNVQAEQFRSPGAPIAGFVGMRYSFGKTGKTEE